jgi:cytochrome P450
MLAAPEIGAPGEVNDIVRPLLGDNSVILLGGDRHKKRRKLLMPPFHGERMRNYGETIANIADKITYSWNQNTAFLARDLMQDITLDVILQVVFGLNEGTRLEELKRRLVDRIEMTSANPFGAIFLFLRFLQKDWGPWSPWGRIMQKQRHMDEAIYDLIRDRRTHFDSDRVDILNLLLSTRDENGEGLSDTELRDELVTLLFAGHETTATALAWALYWIHQCPDVRQKLLAELDGLGENPDPMEIFRLPYLTAVAQESLRIGSPAMLTFPRVVERPVELGGQTLEPGTVVLGCVYLTHQRQDLYPEPHLFKPERFLERQFSPYEFIPFGGGSRRCIGLALANYEMKLVLATILSRWELEIAEEDPVVPQRRGVLLAPKGGIAMRVKGERSRSASVPTPV